MVDLSQDLWHFQPERNLKRKLGKRGSDEVKTNHQRMDGAWLDGIYRR
jgi:hypothetical protein